MSTPSDPKSTVVQPKILQRMLLRFAIGLLVLAALIYGFFAMRGCGDDIDLPVSADTAGMIAAVKYNDEGMQVGVFLPDGKWRPAPDYREGGTDRDHVWRPDGNRLFFVADRGKAEDGGRAPFQIFRWNLASDAVVQRSLGKTSKGSPDFTSGSHPDANGLVLITSGGKVLSLDPKSGYTRQVLPPVPNERTESSEGAMGQFEAMYRAYGSSFREAKWTSDRSHVAAVLRREDGDEMLIIQDLSTLAAPLPVAVGSRIDFAVSPNSGEVFYSVLDFQFPDPNQVPQEFRKNGRVVLPFRHMIGVLDTQAQGTQAAGLVGVSMDEKVGFRSVTVSPDGEMLAVIQGMNEGNGNITPQALAVLPAQAGGAQAMAVVVRGPIYEPSWGPDSRTLAFIRSEGGKRTIYTIARDGSGEKRISGDDASYGFPKISPQQRE